MKNLLFILHLAVALGMASCAAPEAYRRALDNFSMGAKTEMQSRQRTPTPPPPDVTRLDGVFPTQNTPDPAKSFEAYYAQALTEANKALQGRGQLEKNNMLDNCYAIKSLILWRQMRYEEAMQLAREAEPLLTQQNQDEDDQRDLALMRAMQGLVAVEKGYLAWKGQQMDVEKAQQLVGEPQDVRLAAYTLLKNNYAAAVTNEADGAMSIDRGLAIIENARQQVDRHPMIESYLLNAKLAGVDTWGDLLTDLRISARRLGISEIAPNDKPWLEAELARYEMVRKTELAALASLLDGGTSNVLYQYWVSIL